MPGKSPKPLLLRPYFLSLAAAWTLLVGGLNLWDTALSRALLWASGLAGLIVFARHLERHLREREQAQKALWKSQDRFRALVAAMQDWVWEIDAEGRYTYVGSRVRDLLGREPADLLGRRPCEHASPADAPRLAAEVDRLLRERPPFWCCECTLLHRQGHEVAVETQAVPFYDNRGTFLGYRGIDRDITGRRREQEVAERMRVALALEHKNRELRERTAEMEQFLYTVSHDLKSPLVTIHGFTARVLEDVRAGRVDRVDDAIGRVARAARRMMELIDDLLELGRVGRVTHDPERLDLEHLIRDWAADHEDELAARGVRLEIAPGFPPLVADAVRMREVFENLLNNALIHGTRSDPPVIRCGHLLEDGEVRFFVSDSGPGVPVEQQQRIFELFHRLSRDAPGTGVGLAIVRRIAEIHGGRAWVESRPGEGATFWVALPGGLIARDRAA